MPYRIDSATNSALADLIRRELPSDAHSLGQYIRGLDYFRARLQAIDFGGDTLLDLACGAGNWSLAAAPRFRRVIGVDRNAGRLAAAAAGAALLGYTNVSFLKTLAWHLPLADNTVTHILCVNAFQYFPREQQLDVTRELARCATTNALAYFTITRIGYPVQLLATAIRRLSAARMVDAIKAMAFGAASNLVPRVAPRYLLGAQFPKVSRGGGWRVFAAGPECSSAPSLQALYPATFMSLPVMWEYRLSMERVHAATR